MCGIMWLFLGLLRWMGNGKEPVVVTISDFMHAIREVKC